MKKNAPESAKKTSTIDRAAVDSRRSRNSRTSSAGYSIRDSYQANTAITASPAATGPITLVVSQEPLSPPSMMP